MRGRPVLGDDEQGVLGVGGCDPRDARTFEYDSLPAAMAALVLGRSLSASATRVFSRAVVSSMPSLKPSQCSQEKKPAFCQCPASWNSRMQQSIR